MSIKLHHSNEELFKLAESGNSGAMYSIGYRYLKGLGGLPQDVNTANGWFNKAVAAGNNRAIAIVTPSSEPSIQQQSSLNENNFLTVTVWLVLAFFIARLTIRVMKSKKANKHVDLIINEHIKALSLNYKQKIKYDSYGNSFEEQWHKEVNHFIHHVLKKDDLIRNMLLVEQLDYSDVFNKINQAARLHSDSNNSIDTVDVERLSPIEFEHYCADILKANGWQARVTQASGDQGIDIIGKYNDIAVIFQCKKYSSPVGNKAVQEAIAGKQFSRANIAAVVSNATYTSSAIQLANTTGVYLLHYSELRYFEEKISLQATSQMSAVPA